MVWMAVSLKIILCIFPILFLSLMIFQTPLFSDEVGPYTEFLRFGIIFPSSLLLHMWYFSVVVIKIL